MPKKSSRKQPAQEENNEQVENCANQVEEMNETVRSCQEEANRQKAKIERYWREIKKAENTLRMHVYKLTMQHKNCASSNHRIQNWGTCIQKSVRHQTESNKAFLAVGEIAILQMNNEIYNFIAKLEGMIEKASKDGTSPEKLAQWSATLESCKRCLNSVFPELEAPLQYMFENANNAAGFRVPAKVSEETSEALYKKMVQKYKDMGNVAGYNFSKQAPRDSVSQVSAEVLVEEMRKLKFGNVPQPGEKM